MRAACSGFVVLALATVLAINRAHLASAQDVAITYALPGIGSGGKTLQPRAES